MGFGKSFKKFTSNPKRMVLAAGTLGGSELLRATNKSLGLKDLLLGKKDPGSEGGYQELDVAQRPLIETYTEELERLKKYSPKNVENIAASEIANQERLAKSGVEDAERMAQSLIAQRGVGKSAAGISALLGVRRNLGSQINAIRAQQPGLERNLMDQFETNRLNRLGAITGGINQTLGTRLYNEPVAASRVGGFIKPLLAIGGGALGAKYGVQGAQAGYQMGSGLGSMAENFNRR